MMSSGSLCSVWYRSGNLLHLIVGVRPCRCFCLPPSKFRRSSLS
jgi:hypothetical protein